MQRIADPEIAPAVAPGAGEGDFEAAAAESLRGDVVGGGAVEHDKGADSLNQIRLATDVTDAAKIPFAFFAETAQITTLAMGPGGINVDFTKKACWLSWSSAVPR